MASQVGLCNNLTDSSVITLRASWILHAAKQILFDTPILTIYLLQCLCFLLSSTYALIISSWGTPGRCWLHRRGWARVCTRLSMEATIPSTSHSLCAWARKRAACKCLQGSSATFPLMLNKVLKSKPPCKCCSYYQVGCSGFLPRELSCWK